MDSFFIDTKGLGKQSILHLRDDIGTQPDIITTSHSSDFLSNDEDDSGPSDKVSIKRKPLLVKPQSPHIKQTSVKEKKLLKKVNKKKRDIKNKLLDKMKRKLNINDKNDKLPDTVKVKDDDDEFFEVSGDEDENGVPGAPIKFSKVPWTMKSLKMPKKSKPSVQRGDIDPDDTYFNFNKNKSLTSQTLKATRSRATQELLKEKSLPHQPGFENLEVVPSLILPDRILRKQRKIERSKNKGEKWFNLPATEVTEEVKRDLEVIQMRSVLDTKTFYKKNDLKVLPKFFQIGHVADNAADFYHSRIPKKERKRTIVEELLADAKFQLQSKRKYREIVQDKQRTQSRAHKHAQRLKKRKR